MLIRRPSDLTYADVTPRSVYLDRRKFLQAMGIVGATAVAGKGLFELASPSQTAFAATKLTGLAKSPFSTTEKQNTFEDVTHYNNFYEFGTDKGDPAKNSKNFNTSSWSVSIEGEVKKPRKFTMDEILKIAPLEERIYRHRCVEAWSMVIPWDGFPLAKLIDLAQPNPEAKYVKFTSFLDPEHCPAQRSNDLPWPYTEGLTLPEAMNELAFLATGLYGKPLRNQNGAPIRLVVPWKYGFKSAKSLVKIDFVSDRPKTTWNELAPNEYGFYANVNPNVDHPRWSQASERVIGGGFFSGKQPTLMFNGYEKQVAHLYAEMDLRKNF